MAGGGFVLPGLLGWSFVRTFEEGMGVMGARRPVLSVVVFVCVMAGVLAGGTGSAVALVAPSFGSPAGPTEGPLAGEVGVSFGMAVSRATGDVYVSGSNSNRVDEFDGSGSFLLAWGWDVNEASPAQQLQTCTTECHIGGEVGTGALSFPEGVAVDNELSSLSYGDVYVYDTANRRVEKFDSAGKFLLMFGGDVNETTGGNVCVAGEACKSGVAGSGNGQLEGTFAEFYGTSGAGYVAVGPGGAVYVGDRARIEVFEASGVWRENVSLAGLSATGSVTALAVDSAGDMFVKDSGATGVHELEPDGAEKGFQLDAGSESVRGIALDGSGHLYVLDSTGEPHVLEYDTASGKELESFGSGTMLVATSMAYSSTTGGLYITGSNATSEEEFSIVGPHKGESGVWVLSPPAAGPLVEPGSESAIPGLRGTATLEATVDPEGGETTYHFEYVPEAQYASNGFAGATSTPGVTIGSSSDFTDHAVSVPVSGLVPGGVYHYRIVATGSQGTATGPDLSFAPTLPALIEGPSVTNVADTSVTFAARVDPLGASTEYRLEYGTSVAYGHTFSGSAGEGSGYVSFSFHVQSLEPGTVYHYRVVTSSEVGTVDGPDHTFTTQASGKDELTLPDGRAWELVSPADKHGALIEPEISDYSLIQAASDGSKIFYSASEPVGGGPGGRVVVSPTLSVRGPDGWRSQDLTPPYSLPEEGVPTVNVGIEYQREYKLFSPDLSSAVIEPDPFEKPLSSEATEPTLYLRDNGSGSFLPLVTPADVPPGTKFGGELKGTAASFMRFEGATADLSHVVLESRFALTPGAIEGSNLYEWAGGQLRLVNVLPDGKATSLRNNGVLLGRGESSFGMSVHAMSSDGRWVVWSFGDGSHTYVRDMVAKRTIQLGYTGSRFQTMSNDGSKVFFLERGELYVLDTGTETQTDVAVSRESGERSAGVKDAVLGASQDGSYVYFVAIGMLAPGATGGEDSLYVAHYDGSKWSTTYIATLSNEDEKDWAAIEGSEHSYLNLARVSSRVSPDGRYVTFMSNRSLTGYDNLDAVSGEPDEEVYLYDAVKGRLACVSCNPTGARPVGVLDTIGGKGLLVDRPQAWTSYRSSSSGWLAGSIPGWRSEGTDAVYQARFLLDGGRMFFESPDALVPQDTNGVEDVYEYEPVGVGDCTTASVTFSERSGGCVSLISSGTSNAESAFYDASESGNDAFFITASKLVSADYDLSYDVYDAHVCSASAPCVSTPVSPPACTSGDSCKAAPSPQPEIFGPTPSATFSGTGNVIATPPATGVKPRSLSRAQRLARALHACRKKMGKRRRAVCERQARKRYAAKRSRKARSRKANANGRGSGR